MRVRLGDHTTRPLHSVLCDPFAHPHNGESVSLLLADPSFSPGELDGCQVDAMCQLMDLQEIVVDGYRRG